MKSDVHWTSHVKMNEVLMLTVQEENDPQLNQRTRKCHQVSEQETLPKEATRSHLRTHSVSSHTQHILIIIQISEWKREVVFSPHDRV
jgi:hypothetical protein